MQKCLTSVFILLVLIISSSCKELYYSDEIGSDDWVPVIQGTIMEGTSPVVTLSWASGYYDKEVQYISDASVTITDDTGNEIVLSEETKGTYVNYSYTGVQGATYTLHVLMSGGDEFTSAPVTIPVRPVIDSVYANPEEITVYLYDYSGAPVTEKRKGLYIMSDLSNSGDTTLYYRFNTYIVKEMTFVQNPGSLNARQGYTWVAYTLDDLYTIENSIPLAGKQVVPEHDMGFLEYVYEASRGNRQSTAPYTTGWVVVTKVYAIPRSVYDYYYTMKEQLNADDQIFAPVPGQIKSNITCVNNPEKQLAGVFEAASLAVSYKFFHYIDLNLYTSKDLPDFPEGITSGTTIGYPPSFWVTL